MAKHDEFSEGLSHPFDDFQIGDQVEHPKFGVGTILFRSGSGDSTKVIVVFSEEGQKKLALKFAKLKKISEGKPRIAPQVEVAPVAARKEPDLELDEDLEEDLEEVGAIAGDDEEEDILPPEDEADIAFGDEDEEIPYGENEDEEP